MAQKQLRQASAMRIGERGKEKSQKRGFVTRYYKEANQTHENWQSSGWPKTRHGAIKGAVPKIAMSRGMKNLDLPFQTYAKAIVFEAATGRMVYSMKWAGNQLMIVEYDGKSLRLIGAKR